MIADLAGKTAVVTGAASGIGLSLARRFVAEGMNVVLADVEDEALGEAVASIDGPAVGEVTDVSDPDAVGALAERTYESFGTAHVVCNNAGVGTGGPIHKIPVEDWHWVLGVNLFGVVHGIRAFLPRLLEQDLGHIVNTSSIQGLTTGPGWGPYGASKHAVVAVTEVLQAELESRRSAVGATVLCPGAVRTNILWSDRNRPGGARSGPPAAEREATAARFPDALDPDVVAGQVVDAIRTGRRAVLTHADLLAGVRARMDRLVNDLSDVDR